MTTTDDRIDELMSIIEMLSTPGITPEQMDALVAQAKAIQGKKSRRKAP